MLYFRNRHELQHLNLMELTVKADHEAALMHAETTGEVDPAAKAALVAEAEAKYEASLNEYNELRGNMPSSMRKLTNGYKMRKAPEA